MIFIVLNTAMKIYDCFTFYNELDLLEIRFNELYNTVDHFVLVESNQTFTNRPKPFIFEQNLARYQKFLDKVIHVRVDDMPGSADAWDNERHQRNAIVRGLTQANPDDVVIVSDCDEIIRAEAVDQMKTSVSEVFGLRMVLYNFKFNYMRVGAGQYDCWAMAARKRILDTANPDQLRNYRFNLHRAQILEHAGWHFGYLGNKEYLLDKARSFSHQEVNTPEFLAQIDPEASIAKRTSWKQDSDERYEIVDLNEYFPSYVVNNSDKFSQHLLANTGVRAQDLLPG